MAEAFDGPASSSAVDALFSILMTQRAAGCFRFSSELRAQLVPEQIQRLETAIAEHGEERAVTSFVLSWLAGVESARADMWRPAAKKAERWLEKNGGIVAGLDA